MNNAIKCIAALVIGAGAGFAAGYFIQKKRYEKEIADFKAEYRAKNKKVTDNARATADRNEELKEQIKNAADALRNEQQQMDMKRYKEYLQKAQYDTRGSHIEGRDIGAPGEAYVIDQEEYDTDENYEKDIEFSYYNDGVLCDETGDPMSEEERMNTVGHRWIKWFADNPNEDICYVRNDIRSIDYDIVKVNENYYAEGEE